MSTVRTWLTRHDLVDEWRRQQQRRHASPVPRAPFTDGVVEQIVGLRRRGDTFDVISVAAGVDRRDVSDIATRLGLRRSRFPAEVRAAVVERDVSGGVET